MSTHDIDKARETYDGFMGALKWIIPVLVVVTFIVLALIAD